MHVDSLEESQKARRSLLCYLLYKYNMIVLSLSLSFPLALSCVSGSCSLLLQVLIINDWDIKKPKKQFLLRFFDSHRVAFDSLLFFSFRFFGTCCTSFKRWFFSLFLTVLDSYLICKKRLINNCLDGSKSSKYYYVLITHYNNGEI